MHRTILATLALLLGLTAACGDVEGSSAVEAALQQAAGEDALAGGVVVLRDG